MIDYKVDKKLVLHAVKVLREINEKFYEDPSKKKPLIDDNECLFLQVTLKKVPKLKGIKMIKVKLPNSLIKDTTEICLITGDLNKKDRKAETAPDTLHYKELLENHGVSQISEIVTLRQLRTEYKPYEAKQKLLAAYDFFLADSKIVECLPKVLGKHFFTKRKFPLRINLKSGNLKDQIENALSTKVIYVTGHGNSCTSEVAYLHMKKKEIFDNVVSAVDSLKRELPGSFANIMGMYLKTSKSKAVPIYMSFDNPNDVILPELKDEIDFEIDELSTVPNAKVKVFSNGRVMTVKNSEFHSSNAEKEEESELDSEVSDENEVRVAIKCSPDSETTVTEVKKRKLSKKLKKEESDDSVDEEDISAASLNSKRFKAAKEKHSAKGTLPIQTKIVKGKGEDDLEKSVVDKAQLSPVQIKDRRSKAGKKKGIVRAK